MKSRGFSSGQKRRKPKEDPLHALLQSGWQVTGLLFLCFAAITSFWVHLTSQEGALFAGRALQTGVVVSVITVTLIVHWHVTLPKTFRQNSRVALILSTIIVQLLLFHLSEKLVSSVAPESGFRLLVEPYIFAPIVLSLLLGRRHGTFGVVYAGLFGAMVQPTEQAYLFIIYTMITGFVTLFLTRNVRKRSRLVTTGLYAGLTCVLLGVCLGQIDLMGATSDQGDLMFLAQQMGVTVLVSIGVAIVVGGILPILEGVFRITTDISWLELADLNHPVLKKMTMEAPGTYHHSLMVATLAEAAAEKIGARAIMCRVCSYFHDIGKMKKPAYFVENIGDGHNPHDDLTPTMSALVIIAHVKDGVDLALKHRLKPEMVNVIQEHHGSSLIRFFYHRARKHRDEIIEQVKEGKAHEEDIPEVKEESFRYAGPRPRSKESAIISLADSIESAARSLQKPTPKKIEELVEGIVHDRINDGQLDKADLTLEELSKIQASFISSLRSMLHARIEYPKLDETNGKSSDAKRKKRAKEKGASEAKAKETVPQGATTEAKH